MDAKQAELEKPNADEAYEEVKHADQSAIAAQWVVLRKADGFGCNGLQQHGEIGKSGFCRLPVSLRMAGYRISAQFHLKLCQSLSISMHTFISLASIT